MSNRSWVRLAIGSGSGRRDEVHQGQPRLRASRTLLGLGLGAAMAWGLAGCHQTPPATSNTTVDQNGADPADANMASVGGSAQPAQVLGQNAQYQPQQQGEDYSQQQAAPIERVAPNSGDQSYSDYSQPSDQAADPYATDLTDEQASQPPPPLPDYDQPPDPDPDYLWTPGYWAWSPGGYYWVPGAWVAAPYVGALWTPGYWGFVGGYYRWHHGFWGPHIGFYGGVDYGFGYTGYGYYGGYWNGGHFFYNTAVNRVNVNVVRNVYVHNVVIDNRTVNGASVDRASFNGGRGGVQAQPRAAELMVLHEQRNAPMAAQAQVQHEAAQNKQQFYSANHGHPAVAVAARPIVADRTPPAVLPRVIPPAPRAQIQPGQSQAPGHPQPGQPARNAPEAARQVQAPEARQMPAPQDRPGQIQPGQVRPNEPQARPAHPQPEARPAQPQPQGRPAQPEARPAQPQPQARPAQPEPRSEAQPRPEARPAQPEPRPEAQPAPHPQPAPHSQAAPHPAPKPPPPPRDEEKPHQ